MCGLAVSPGNRESHTARNGQESHTQEGPSVDLRFGVRWMLVRSLSSLSTLTIKSREVDHGVNSAYCT